MKKRAAGLFAILAVCLAVPAWAGTAGEIDANVETTLDRFYDEVSSGKNMIKDAKGVLVFPNVYKGGIGVGGEYGEGSLQIKGKTVDYYSTAAASVGFQLGVQKKSIVILFMEEDALKKFRQSEGWKAGVDASIALVTLGAGGEMDTAKYKEPILGFIIGQKGLMYNLTLEGAKFSKLKK